ncbi:helix-turn-helix domain-containing protein [Colwelliaceae bacterium 6441]
MEFDYLGSFIRSYRQANQETLQSLADRSSVSRSMISQIESGQKSPTIVVLSKLAKAMNISLEDFVKPPVGSQEVNILSPSKQNIVSKKNSSFVCHQLMSKSASSPADFYRFYFVKYGKTAFAANSTNGANKYLWVDSGTLAVHLASQLIYVEAGNAITFNANLPHRFENRFGELVQGTFFVAYQ